MSDQIWFCRFSLMVMVSLSLLLLSTGFGVRGVSAVCDGTHASGCGCFKYTGRCYTFVDDPPRDFFCFTQVLGTPAGQGQWANCAANHHNQCDRAMTCGDGKKYVASGADFKPVTTPASEE